MKRIETVKALGDDVSDSACAGQNSIHSRALSANTRSVFLIVALTALHPVHGLASDEQTFTKSLTFEEVLVTADRKVESTLDIPMTISAFNAQMLDTLLIQDVDKLQNLVPGLQFGDNIDQEGNSISLRGIGTKTAGINHFDLSVASYIDGAYTVGVYGMLPAGGFDLERVEVARGPQGTLNGRNSIAGSVNYFYKKPTRYWDADLLLEATDVQQQRINIAVGGPLGDLFSFRLTGGKHIGDGLQENIGLGADQHAPDHLFQAIQIRLETGKLDANVRFARVEDSGIPRARVPLANVNRTDETIPASGYEAGPENFIPNTNYLYETPNPAGPTDCPVDVPFMQCGDIKNRVALNTTGREASKAERVNFYADYKFNERVSLRYTYSNNDVEQNNFKDADYTNRVGLPEANYLASDGGVPGFQDRAYELPYIYEETSHELLLRASAGDRTQVISGLFHYESEIVWDIIRYEFGLPWRFIDNDEVARGSSFFGVPYDTCQEFLDRVGGPVFGYASSKEESKETGNPFVYCPSSTGEQGRIAGDLNKIISFATTSINSTRAAFVNIDHEINQQFLVSMGLRYLEDEKSQPPGREYGSFMGDFWSPSELILIGEGASPGTDETKTYSALLGQATIEYRPNKNYMLYGRMSTGHKPGIFNSGFADDGLGTQRILPESTVENFEVGLKGTFFDGKLRLASSVYKMNWDGMQMELRTPPVAGFEAVSPDLIDQYVSIPNTELWGVETEYTYFLTETLRLFGFYAYSDSKIGDISSVEIGAPSPQFEYGSLVSGEEGFYQVPTEQTGNSLPSQPSHKFSLSLSKEYEVSSVGFLDFIASYSYVGSQYQNIWNIDLFELPSYDRLDVSATWTSFEGGLSLTVFANNVFDEIGVIEFMPAGSYGGQRNLSTLTNHREFGVRLRYTPYF